jgi:hypothetical protein
MSAFADRGPIADVLEFPTFKTFKLNHHLILAWLESHQSLRYKACHEQPAA